MLNTLTAERNTVNRSNAPSLPKTGRGRALYTVHWVLTGKRPSRHYDHAPALSAIWPLFEATSGQRRQLKEQVQDIAGDGA